MWWSHLKHRFINFWPHLNTKIIGCRLPVPQSQLPVDSGRVQRLSSRVAGNKRFHLAPKMSCGIGGVRKMNLVNGKWDALVETCPQQNYQAAVAQLNRLQPNTVTSALSQEKAEDRLLDSRRYLLRSGVTEEHLDRIPIIHVSGTKGKGSVCSFVESILREHGLKTGFFSSPHLVSVTERIRLNGAPMTEKHFAGQFWRLFNQLDGSKEAPDDLPHYFQFLTLMALHVFLVERVDVAIMEVGIGGLYDCTNIIRGTKTVGITSLGLDHVAMLGDTVEKIAHQKAGIIKRQSHVYTVPQLGRANEVINATAAEKGATVTIVPDFEEYTWNRPLKLNLTKTSMHKLNISMAIQLAIDWMVQQGRLPETQDRRMCPEEITAGIEKFHWPGRYQVIVRGPNRFHLDGAHTRESVEACLEWFHETSRQKGESTKCLVFFVTGTRDIKSLAEPFLQKGLFDLIIICPDVVDSQASVLDNVKANSSSQDSERKCKEIGDTFRILAEGTVPVKVTTNFTDALRLVDETVGCKKDILVTGSLYLVGTALIALNQEHYETPAEEKS